MNAQYNFENVSQRPPPSSYARQQGTSNAARIPTAVRIGPGQERPVTSNRGAGFPATSQGRMKADGTISTTTSVLKPPEETPEILFRRLEKELNTLLDNSAEAKSAGNITSALNFAKEIAWVGITIVLFFKYLRRVYFIRNVPTWTSTALKISSKR